LSWTYQDDDDDDLHRFDDIDIDIDNDINAIDDQYLDEYDQFSLNDDDQHPWDCGQLYRRHPSAKLQLHDQSDPCPVYLRCELVDRLRRTHLHVDVR
jgi:hypothetical protein